MAPIWSHRPLRGRRFLIRCSKNKFWISFDFVQLNSLHIILYNIHSKISIIKLFQPNLRMMYNLRHMGIKYGQIKYFCKNTINNSIVSLWTNQFGGSFVQKYKINKNLSFNLKQVTLAYRNLYWSKSTILSSVCLQLKSIWNLCSIFDAISSVFLDKGLPIFYPLNISLYLQSNQINSNFIWAYVKKCF